MAARARPRAWVTVAIGLVLLIAACGSSHPSASPPRTTHRSTSSTSSTTTTARPTTTTARPTTTSVRPATTGGPSTTAGSFAAQIAALPDGGGARLAIVVDDVGGPDTYLDGYLRLPVPLTFAVMPMATNAARDDAAITAAGRTALLHIPLPVGSNPAAPGGLAMGATDADVAAYLDAAQARVPHAVGANNHQGSAGTADAGLMDRLLRALQARHLFFLDSVTTQKTMGYATELRLGMPPRINNVFLDNDASSPEPQLLQLARLAAAHGTAIGICHTTRPWVLATLAPVVDQLLAKGYRFAPLGEVTNGPAGGLDVGVRAAAA